MLHNEFIKVIIPVLIKYIKWYDETQEMESIMSSIDTTGEEQKGTGHKSSVLKSKFMG
jgi:hypothetical protein